MKQSNYAGRKPTDQVPMADIMMLLSPNGREICIPVGCPSPRDPCLLLLLLFVGQENRFQRVETREICLNVGLESFGRERICQKKSGRNRR